MHNLILAKTLATVPKLTTSERGSVSRARLREAFRAAARQAFAQRRAEFVAAVAGEVRDETLDEQLEQLLDDAYLDLFEGRFYELKALLTRTAPPRAEELETLFRSWGITGVDAQRAASFALLATDAERVPASNSSASASGSSKEAELRLLGGSSPTLAMIHAVYRASSDFWRGMAPETPFAQNGSFKEDKWEICLTIVMDAEGGLGGLLLGPIGSILASTVYSILWVATGP